jgi:HSP20 family protein
MSAQEVALQEKKEVETDGERTEAGKYYSPYTDIHETAKEIIVTMDMPGVKRSDVDIHIEKNILTIVGSVDFSNYEGLEPLYTEYNVGNFSRSFTLSTAIDSQKIKAEMADGVLRLVLPKAPEAVARRIEVK